MSSRPRTSSSIGCGRRPRRSSFPATTTFEWWKSPFSLLGERRKYCQVHPVLRRSSAGAGGSRCCHRRRPEQLWRGPRVAHLEGADLAVKGHLPRSETNRVKKIFDACLRVAHGSWFPPQRARGRPFPPHGTGPVALGPSRLLATGADVILSGHDHQEGAGQIQGVARGEHCRDPQLPSARRTAVGVQPGEDRRAGDSHPALPLGVRRSGSSSPRIPSRLRAGAAAGGGVGCGWGSRTVKAGQPAGLEDSLPVGFRPLACVTSSRIVVTPNRTVMLSLSKRVLRVHRGYAFAPDRVLQAIVRFLNPRVPRALRRWRSGSSWRFRSRRTRPSPRARRRERARPGDCRTPAPAGQPAPPASTLNTSAARWATSRFGSRAGCAPGWASCRSRSGPDGRSRSPSAGVTSRGTPGPRSSTPCCTRWSTSGRRKPGCRIDHGRTFRPKAREVGVLPVARRPVTPVASGLRELS